MNPTAEFPARPREKPDAAARAELAALIARAQSAEPAAQAELVRRYTHRIAAFVRPIISQPSAVDDVVQLVMIKMLRRLDVLRDAGAFEGWLLALARNTALDSLRRRRCRPLTVWDEREVAAAPDSDSLRRVSEIMEALEFALRQLSPRDRHLVEMIVHGESYQAAAAREGLSVGAVKLRLNRVRPFLRVSVGGAIGAVPRAEAAFRRPPRGRLAA